MTVRRFFSLVLLVPVATMWGSGLSGCAPKGGLNAEAKKPTLPPIPPGCTRKVKEEPLPNGKLLERTEGYVDSEGVFTRHGESDEWYENGQKKKEKHYVNGVVDGPRLTWYDTGQIWARGAYNHGKSDGTWTAWFPNGFRQREWHMHDGVWNGLYTEFHENGEKKFEVEYIQGKKQGPAFWWSEIGTELRHLEYLDDVVQP